MQRPFRQLNQEVLSVNDWWNWRLSYMNEALASFEVKSMKLDWTTQWLHGTSRLAYSGISAGRFTRMSTDQKDFVIAGTTLHYQQTISTPKSQTNILQIENKYFLRFATHI